MNIRIGSAPDSWGVWFASDPRQTPWQRYLDEVAEAHVEYEDQIEAFLEQTDPERVFLCFDTGHHAYRGGDPIAFMRRHHRRIPYLHLKSVDRDIQKKVEA